LTNHSLLTVPPPPPPTNCFIQGEDIPGFKWPCSDVRSCFAVVLPHRTYYLVCGHVDEALDWQKIIGALAFTEGDGPSDGGGGSDVSDDSEDDEEEDDSGSAMTMLSAALQANSEAGFQRSESVMRVRLDTHCSSMLKRVRFLFLVWLFLVSASTSGHIDIAGSCTTSPSYANSLVKYVAGIRACGRGRASGRQVASLHLTNTAASS
jgi:hypothetical protein